MKKIMNLKGSLILGLLLAGPVGLLSAGDSEPDAQCSNRTIRGAYGFSVEGMFLPSGNQPAAVLRAVALTTFDGRGGLTQIDHYVVNGVPQTPPGDDWPASKGSYTVNSDCTGKLTLIVPNFPPFVSYFVVVRGGKEIRTVLNANLVSSVGLKIE